MRYISFAVLFFSLSGLIFYSIYTFTVKKLKLETEKVENIKIAEKTKIIIFKNKRAIWLLYGKKADFSNPQNVKIEDFEAKNLKNYLKVKALVAYFVDFSKIKLYKNVVINFLEKGKPVIVETDSAIVNTKRKLIYGNGKVIVKKRGETLVGEGFQYDIKTGKFIILRNVQTYLISP